MVGKKLMFLGLCLFCVLSLSANDLIKSRKITPVNDNLVVVQDDDPYPPRTHIWFTNAKNCYKDGKLYYSKGVTLNLKASDTGSGVKSIYYAFNGGDYKQYDSPVELQTEQDYTISYYAVDNAGNKETPKTKTVYVDFTPPTSRLVLSNDQTGMSVIEPKLTTLSVESTDEGTGVAGIWYSYNGRRERPFTQPIWVNQFQSGKYDFEFYAKDKAGNIEEKKTYSFAIDREPPKVELVDIMGDNSEINGRYYVSGMSQFILKAEDAISGVDRVHYAFNDPDFVRLYRFPFNVRSLESGNHTLYIWAVDKRGNSSPYKTFKLNVDTKPPTSTATIGQPNLKKGDIYYITSETAISLSAKDAESGVKEIRYEVDFYDYKPYNNAIKVEGEGEHKVKFKASDKLNNTEAVVALPVIVDNTAPDIEITFGGSATGKQERGGKEYPVYQRNTSINVEAVDQYSGTKKITYMINDGGEETYSPQKRITISKSGFFALKVKAVDNLGNETEEVVGFFIE